MCGGFRWDVCPIFQSLDLSLSLCVCVCVCLSLSFSLCLYNDVTTQYLDHCLSNIEHQYQHATVVILGDTNRYNSDTICIRHGLKQVVASATRKASQLNSIFTNIPSLYEPPVLPPPVGTSDHQTIMLRGGKWPTRPTQYITCCKCTPETMWQLGLLMNMTDFSNIYAASDPEVKVSLFTASLQYILD